MPVYYVNFFINDRWKRDKQNRIVKHKVSKKPILQFVAIVRRDHGDWAIPGVRISQQTNGLQDMTGCIFTIYVYDDRV
mgnify:CR=1 FL=1